MLGEKGLCKVHKVGNDLVVSVRPIGGELKAVGGFLSALSACALVLFDDNADALIANLRRQLELLNNCRFTDKEWDSFFKSGCAVGNHKNLHILIQPTARPEAVTLITVNLVERLFDRDTTPDCKIFSSVVKNVKPP